MVYMTMHQDGGRYVFQQALNLHSVTWKLCWEASEAAHVVLTLQWKDHNLNAMLLI